MISQLTKITRCFLLAVVLFVPSAMVAMHRGGGGQDDPWSRMDYDYAFDAKRFKEHKGLLEHWGCADNVFKHMSDESIAPVEYDESAEPEPAESRGILQCARSSMAPYMCCCTARHPGYNRVPTEQAEPDYAKQEKEFRAACLRRLKYARWWATMKPAAEDASTCAFIGAAACCITKRQGNQGLGGGLAEGNCIFDTAFLAKSVIESLFTCWSPPVNSLEKLEERFAFEQCFIPQELWPKIIEQFKQARANSLSQQEYIRSLELLLDFCSNKPKRAVTMHTESQEADSAKSERERAQEILRAPEVQEILIAKIDRMLKEFCAQYEPMDRREYNLLANCILNFVNRVMYNRGEVRPLFLVGPWGIGKTHFFEVLQNWLEEILPGAINMAQPEISSSEKLEGSQHEPGLFLNTLRKQLRSRDKRGSLVFLDEAIWLNTQQNSAKRAFSDEKLSKIVTDFFGTPNDITLDMSPALFLIASNDDITDPNLQSKFGIIHFPRPKKKEALVPYAQDYVEQAPIGDLVQTASPEKREAIKKAVEKEIMTCSVEKQNFRAAKRAEVLVTGMFLDDLEKTVPVSHDEVKRLAIEAALKRMSAPVPVSMDDQSSSKPEMAKKTE